MGLRSWIKRRSSRKPKNALHATLDRNTKFSIAMDMEYTAKYHKAEVHYNSILKKALKLIDDGDDVYERASKAFLSRHDLYVPKEIIAILHYLEAHCDFTRNPANGQLINRKTTIIPKGLGPYSTWLDSAVDILWHKRNIFPSDWGDVGEVLYFFERFNGMGYRMRGFNSPYLYAMTNLYGKGRYVRDGKFDKKAPTKIAGALPILKSLNYIKEQQIVSLTSI